MRDVIEQIVDQDLVYMRRGTIVYDSRLKTHLSDADLARLLTIIEDHIIENDGEVIDWPGVIKEICKRHEQKGQEHASIDTTPALGLADSGQTQDV